ncbi:MAG: magnesium chelatase ATPase subunit I [Anaerolineae bacterium]
MTKTHKSEQHPNGTHASTLSVAGKNKPVFPFTAIVGQDDLKLSLLLCVIDPTIGGVMVMGHRGTGKSTAVRALAALLPKMSFITGCPYNCDPDHPASNCPHCNGDYDGTQHNGDVPVIDLPLGATEDRVVGSMDVERALVDGVQSFAPGLLARANRGFLYIDEVNLLEDHLVDLLLDVAASGVNVVEREGISIRHPARFVLVGSGNPEEGDLRPQLLDRFGLHARIKTIFDLGERVEIVKRRRAYDFDPHAFAETWEDEQAKLRKQILHAQALFPEVKLTDAAIHTAAKICVALEVDGHRGELTLCRAAVALTALKGRNTTRSQDVADVAVMALQHRLRKDPLETAGDDARILRVVDEIMAQ